MLLVLVASASSGAEERTEGILLSHTRALRFVTALSTLRHIKHDPWPRIFFNEVQDVSCVSVWLCFKSAASERDGREPGRAVSSVSGPALPSEQLSPARHWWQSSVEICFVCTSSRIFIWLLTVSLGENVCWNWDFYLRKGCMI